MENIPYLLSYLIKFWYVLGIILIIITSFVIRNKLSYYIIIIFKKIKKILSVLKRHLVIAIKNINLYFKDYPFEKYIFAIVLFLISLFSFFLYLILKGILSTNFGDITWFPLKTVVYIIVLFNLVFLVLPLIYKYQNIFIQYFLFPAITFIVFFLRSTDIIGDFSLFIIILIILVLHLIFLKKVWTPVNKRNKRLLISIFLIILLLNIGSVFINIYTGERRMDFDLTNCYGNHEKLGEIKCADLNNHVISGNKVYCKFQNMIIESFPGEGKVNFTFADGSSKTEKIYSNESYSFIVPFNLSYISFEFRDNNTCFSVGWPIRYPNYEEFKTEKNSFMYLTLALLGFCLLSVPIIVKNFLSLQ
ncbi:MAG: hypothetical protein WC796_01910 [Candidatus Pacearchaeota archaeon]|jgi:hypothetical protein